MNQIRHLNLARATIPAKPGVGELSSKVRVLQGVQPLFFDDDQVVVAFRNQVSKLTSDLGRVRSFMLECDVVNRLLDRSDLLFRMRRSSVFSAGSYESSWYFTYRKKLISYDPNAEVSRLEFSFARGRGPLQLAALFGEGGASPGVYFGEYFRNHSRRPLHIYFRESAARWRIVYTFPEHVIEHIHALIPDSYRDCVWVLTGDYGHGAAIWVTTDGFRSLTRVVSGDQQYRTCVAFPIRQGLLYATDSQLEANHIRFLHYQPSCGWRSDAIARINGPCMYGCETKSFFVFSTSTEPIPFTGNPLRDYLTRKPGPGIDTNASDILLVPKDDPFSCVRLYRAEKDKLPYRLFQFGTVRFPAGQNPTDRLYAYFVGSQEHDCSTVCWDLK